MNKKQLIYEKPVFIDINEMTRTAKKEADQEVEVQGQLRKAIKKYGVPKKVYFDNNEPIQQKSFVEKIFSGSHEEQVARIIKTLF